MRIRRCNVDCFVTIEFLLLFKMGFFLRLFQTLQVPSVIHSFNLFTYSDQYILQLHAEQRKWEPVNNTGHGIHECKEMQMVDDKSATTNKNLWK
jgi:hypothetical protein